GRHLVANRLGGRRPQVARLLVAQVIGFASTSGDRIVRPRCELVLAAADCPGVTAAIGSDLKAEGRVRDDVDPWRGRRLTRTKDRHILGSVGGEGTKTVEE